MFDFKSWKSSFIMGFFLACGAHLGWKTVAIVLGWILCGVAALAGSE